MRSTWDMKYRHTAHGAFARGDRRETRGFFDDPNLADPEHSEAAMRREFAWTLVGCSTVIVAANLLGALLAAN